MLGRAPPATGRLLPGGLGGAVHSRSHLCAREDREGEVYLATAVRSEQPKDGEAVRGNRDDLITPLASSPPLFLSYSSIFSYTWRASLSLTDSSARLRLAVDGHETVLELRHDLLLRPLHGAQLHVVLGELVKLTGEGEQVVAVRVARAHEDVLRPVAEHQEEGIDQRVDPEDPEGPDGVDTVQDGGNDKEETDASDAVERETVALPPQGVVRELNPDGEQEAEPVDDKMGEVVALVGLGRADVVGKDVVLDMMHHAMVQVVDPTGNAEKRRQEVGRNKVQHGGLEDGAV
eukprot:573654-Hanusia_phi.AAC.2